MDSCVENKCLWSRWLDQTPDRVWIFQFIPPYFLSAYYLCKWWLQEDKDGAYSLTSSSQTNPSFEGCGAAHPKASQAGQQPLGLGGFESLLEKAVKLKLREQWSAAVKQSTHFFVTLNSLHEDPECDFQLLGPVELPEGKSWLLAIMESQPDLEWVVLK